MKTKARVSRWLMAGGVGTAYEVLVPHQGWPHVTAVYPNGASGLAYARVWEALAAIRNLYTLPPLSDERWEAFKAARRDAKRIEFETAVQVFSELRRLGRLPELWAPWRMPEAVVEVEVELE